MMKNNRRKTRKSKTHNDRSSVLQLYPHVVSFLLRSQCEVTQDQLLLKSPPQEKILILLLLTVFVLKNLR